MLTGLLSMADSTCSPPQPPVQGGTGPHQENAAQPFPQDRLGEGIFSVEVTSSQMILTLVELTKFDWHRGPGYDILA